MTDSLPRLTTKKYSIIRSIAAGKGMKNIKINISSGSTHGDNFLGEILNVQVSGKIDNIDQCLTFILKNAPKTDDNEMMNNVYRKEISLYKYVLPVLLECLRGTEFRIPKYFDGSTIEKDEFVLLEHIGPSGYKMYDRRKSFDGDHLIIVTKVLAKFHASSFILQKINPEKYVEFANMTQFEISYDGFSESALDQSKVNAIECIADIAVKEKFRKFLFDPSKKAKAYIDAKKTYPYNALTHGDCWIGNVMFKYEEDKPVDMALLDWQTARMASPVTDIANMISLCTDKDVRDSHYQLILDFYYETLAEEIKLADLNPDELYPKEIFKRQIKDIMAYGLLTALGALPMLLVEDYGIEDYERAGEDDNWLTVPLSKNCKERINGLVEDFVKYEYI